MYAPVHFQRETDRMQLDVCLGEEAGYFLIYTAVS